jgi:nitrite reductase (NO-forming)
MSRFASIRLVVLLALAALVAVAVTASGERASPGRAGAQEAPYRIHGRGTGHVVEVSLDAVETVQEVAPGVKYRVWTFGGTAPGPVIRVKVGDTVRFRLRNRTTRNLAHSIDFHAAQTPWDRDYRPVAPGKTFSFDWVARFPGVFMYHCGVPPVLHHIANGMYGAIIVEPQRPLPAAREYVLVSSEFYAGDRPVDGAFEGDVRKMLVPAPTQVVFNGKADRYLESPLLARPGERIRLWVMNAGPTLTTAFHVIGAVFDHVYPDGNPTNALNGIQTWAVPPGGGAMFELTIPDEGLYPFVTHSFAYTGLGAVGVIRVGNDAPPRPRSYPAMADPFSGGLTAVGGTIAVEPTTRPSAPGGSAPPEEPAGPEAKALRLGIHNVAFAASSLEAREGAIALTLVNADPIPHDFTVDELGVKFAVGAGETRTFSFEAGPGSNEFYCSVPGHREAGMVGTLTVLPGTGH